MINCEQARAALHLYLDGELAPLDELELEAHLVGCVGCCAHHDAMRHVVDTVRGAKPLYESSPELRDKLAHLVTSTSQPPRKWSRRLGWPAAVAASIALLVLLLPTFRRSTFTAYAADAHLRYATGKLPLDVASDQPQVVSSWLQSHLTFHLNVPQYPADASEPKAYTLAGARLMQYEGEDIAYLAYTMNSRPVSLLVSSSAHIVVPAGQDVYRSGNLLFHFTEHKGLKLITWRDRDLVYALVSDVQVSNAQSCVVCHGSAAERSRFENMAPEHP